MRTLSISQVTTVKCKYYPVYTDKCFVQIKFGATRSEIMPGWFFADVQPNSEDSPNLMTMEPKPYEVGVCNTNIVTDVGRRYKESVIRSVPGKE